MQTKKLATAFMVGAFSMLLLTFGSFQSAYAGGRGKPPVKPPQKIGSAQQLRLNKPQFRGSSKYIGSQSYYKGPPNNMGVGIYLPGGN